MRLDQKNLNERMWEVIKLYSKAAKAGFKIEEIVLFNYMLRARLLLIVEMQCLKKGKSFKKGWLKNETNQLASLAFQLNGIDKKLYNDLKVFYKSIRSYLIHNLINEPINLETFEAYDKNKGDLQKRLQSALGVKIKVTPNQTRE